MKKSFVVLLHIGFWACYFLMMFIVLGIYSRSVADKADQVARVWNAFYSVLLFAFIPSVISYFIYYFILFPKYLEQKKILPAILLGLLSSGVAAILGYIIIRYFIETGRIIDMDEGGIHGRSTAGRVILVMTTIGALCGTVAFVIRGFVTWYNEIKLKEALRDKSHAMEMALVKSQLDPHLLFNTINNIDALILKDSVAASEYLNKLSDILRFILYETKGDKIPLAKELEYITTYIALQKIWTANENYVHFTVEGPAGNKSIAPMVFIPFIENAFKHTNNKKLENAIRVQIRIREEDIQFLCENKFDPRPAGQATAGGLGNELIKKRLNLIYGGKHTLAMQKTNDRYLVHLAIPHG